MEKKLEQKQVRIKLTMEQKEKLRTVTGKEFNELRFTVVELEEPTTMLLASSYAR
jgi:hypothetical protein